MRLHVARYGVSNAACFTLCHFTLENEEVHDEESVFFITVVIDKPTSVSKILGRHVVSRHHFLQLAEELIFPRLGRDVVVRI